MRIANNTSAPIKVIEIGANKQQNSLRNLPAGQSYIQSAAPGSTLAFAQNGAWLGGAYTVTAEKQQAVTPPYAAAQSAAAGPGIAGGAPVQFTNSTATAVTVASVGKSNNATALYVIGPGQTVTRQAAPKSTLYFYPAGKTAPVGDDYLVTGQQDRVTIPYDATAALKAREAGPGSIAIEVRNETTGDVDVAMADNDGIRRNLAVVKRGNSVPKGVGTDIKAQPGANLYFLAATSASGAQPTSVGSYQVDRNGPEIVYVPYDPQSYSQQHSTSAGAVSVQFNNTSRNELTCYNGQKKMLFSLAAGVDSWRNLPPNSTVAVYGPSQTGGKQLALLGSPITIGANPGQIYALPPAAGAAGSSLSGIDLTALENQIVTNLVQQQAAEAAATPPTVCWKDTYGRGVGTIPTSCPPGQSQDTKGLCYTNCAPGYTAAVTMCVPGCPPGLRTTACIASSPPRSLAIPTHGNLATASTWMAPWPDVSKFTATIARSRTTTPWSIRPVRRTISRPRSSPTSARRFVRTA